MAEKMRLSFIISAPEEEEDKSKLSDREKSILKLSKILKHRRKLLHDKADFYLKNSHPNPITKVYHCTWEPNCKRAIRGLGNFRRHLSWHNKTIEEENLKKWKDEHPEIWPPEIQVRNREPLMAQAVTPPHDSFEQWREVAKRIQRGNNEEFYYVPLCKTTSSFVPFCNISFPLSCQKNSAGEWQSS
jgi:hypothetical protein